MKRKELGITEGEVVADLRGGCCAIYLKERVSDTNGCHFEDKRNIFYSSKGAKFNGSHWDMDEETQNNFALIADAFNTANKCGLLPSELLEQNRKLLSALKDLVVYCRENMTNQLEPLISKANEIINQNEQ